MIGSVVNVFLCANDMDRFSHVLHKHVQSDDPVLSYRASIIGKALNEINSHGIVYTLSLISEYKSSMSSQHSSIVYNQASKRIFKVLGSYDLYP